MTTEAMTQEETVLDYLKRFGKITHLKALTDLNIGRLSEYIRRLRNKGYNIETEMKESYTGRQYAEYRLSVAPEPAKTEVFKKGGHARFNGSGGVSNLKFGVAQHWTEGCVYKIEAVDDSDGSLLIYDHMSAPCPQSFWAEQRFFTPA